MIGGFAALCVPVDCIVVSEDIIALGFVIYTDLY
jgi:hypothetical protein